MWLFAGIFMVIGGWLVLVADQAIAQTAPDPFVAAVNEKQAEVGRDVGVFGDQLLRDHATLNQQAQQIAELTKENADLKAKLGQAPAATPEKK